MDSNIIHISEWNGCQTYNKTSRIEGSPGDAVLYPDGIREGLPFLGNPYQDCPLFSILLHLESSPMPSISHFPELEGFLSRGVRGDRVPPHLQGV